MFSTHDDYKLFLQSTINCKYFFHGIFKKRYVNPVPQCNAQELTQSGETEKIVTKIGIQESKLSSKLPADDLDQPSAVTVYLPDIPLFYSATRDN